MDLDMMLAEAAPARHADLPGPDSPAAAGLYQRIIARPPDRQMFRRPRFAASALIAVTAAAAAVAIALALAPGLPAVGPRAPVHARLAAWSVTRQPGGIVTITIRELHNLAGLSRLLRADNLPIVVDFPPKYFEPTTSIYAIPAGCRPPHLSDRANADLQNKIMNPLPLPTATPVRPHAKATPVTSHVAPVISHSLGRSASWLLFHNPRASAFGRGAKEPWPDVVLTIMPSAIPHGIGLFLKAWVAPVGTKSGPTFSMQTTLVQATPRCLGR